MNSNVSILCILAAFFLFCAWMNRRAKRPKPKRVEQYEISLQEVRGKPHQLLLAFHAEDGSTSLFTLSPGYAHHLSDELCRSSATAARPKEKDVNRAES